ncbi:MAG: hypothetical protein ASARMPREDX12_003680 [Alectoria sarmentosa]|nr:MAG: hypothetical protein ASARMPREDX12_003680 [Alectoria sarmentosa]
MVAGIRESDIRKAYKGIYTYRQDLVEENGVDEYGNGDLESTLRLLPPPPSPLSERVLRLLADFGFDVAVADTPVSVGVAGGASVVVFDFLTDADGSEEKVVEDEAAAAGAEETIVKREGAVMGVVERVVEEEEEEVAAGAEETIVKKEGAVMGVVERVVEEEEEAAAGAEETIVKKEGVVVGVGEKVEKQVAAEGEEIPLSADEDRDPISEIHSPMQKGLMT